MSKYNEAAFETAIEIYLTEQGGFIKRDKMQFDRDLCLDTEVFIDFIKATQPKEWDYLFNIHKNNTAPILIEDLVRALNSEHEGCLDVLRHGFKCYGKLIHAAYFAPVSGMNPETKRLYDANIQTITRQARFSTKHEQSVDIVLTINGIPVATLELKNPMTGQTWRNAVHQYKSDRDHNDTLFAFKKRALVHFAVDTDEADLTTKLAGANTSFLPFNKGRAREQGTPPIPMATKRLTCGKRFSPAIP